ncbi:hypothetical protein HDA32_005648 [Spinactinospora alkalitolerans]|uniref:DUF308 domain-containing protein n=1 Tax=Spinactinospora alkalitolerans TaxID=687207 RepID=A0A852U2S5_9ACTN|nr:hypothetical protein [Spinactinospora alkalitolerans]NYE50528.1 hypothetical protein [Spinactinospora alkalitolerans]
MALTRGERALVWAGFPLAGAALGWLVKAVAGWAASLPWTPFQGPLELIASFPEPQATVGCLVLGLVGGLVVALLAEDDHMAVTVDDDRVTVARGSSSRDVRRASIEAVFLDGKQLVLLGRETEELVRQGGDIDTGRLERAFLAHGYPWCADGDPHGADYRRWVPDLPDLSPGAHALLKARARALKKKDRADAELLRAELAELGIVLRDRDGRQYWRRTGRPPRE